MTTSCDDASTTAQKYSSGRVAPPTLESTEVSAHTTYTLLPSGSTPTPRAWKLLASSGFSR